MELSEKQKRAQDFQQLLISKCWESEKFKEQLIANPKSTIKEMSDGEFTFPENLKLIVEDQTDVGKVYLNIPRKLNSDNLELTDEQLEIVAGGEVGVVVAIGALLLIAYNGYQDAQDSKKQ